MTTIRHDGNIQLECDNPNCNNVTPVWDKTDFKIMMDHARSAGWNTFKRDGEWRNYCCWLCSAPPQPVKEG